MNLEKFNAAVNTGLRDDNWSLLDEWIARESSLTYKFGSEPGDEAFDWQVFDQIIEWMTLGRFLDSDGFYKVLVFIEQNWSILSDSQQRILLSTLEDAIKGTKSDLGRFVGIEIIGEFFSDSRAFDLLTKFAHGEYLQLRSLIPAGYGHIISESSDPKLIAKAYQALLKMSEDPNIDVKKEAWRVIEKSSPLLHRFN